MKKTSDPLTEVLAVEGGGVVVVERNYIPVSIEAFMAARQNQNTTKEIPAYPVLQLGELSGNTMSPDTGFCPKYISEMKFHGTQVSSCT